MGKGQTRQFPCSRPIKGRYVFVVLNVNEYLTLCEVEVYGVRGLYSFTYTLNIVHFSLVKNTFTRFSE